jgi:Fic family protein
VFVSAHQPPPPSLLSMLMAKFVYWLNADRNLHPVRHAALAHYKLV